MVAARLRIMIFLCRSGRRRSRYRYFKRSSSFVLLFSSMGNGGTSDSERIRRDLARTSMVPVFKLGFAAPDRFSTIPVTATVNSLLNRSALEKLSSPQSLSSKMIWMIPERSLRSVKIIPPLFLLF